MNRKEFFKRLAVATGVAILAPRVLLDNKELINPSGKTILIEGTYKRTNCIQVARPKELYYFLNTKNNIDNR